jgi:ankyrin repeat protein
MKRRGVLVCGGLILSLLAAGMLCWHLVGSDRRDRALIAAVEAGDLAAAQVLLNEGADANGRKAANDSGPLAALQFWDRSRHEGVTALSVAVAGKKWPLAALLIERGANVSGATGVEALHQAGADGATEFMRALLDHGVPVDGRALHGQEDPAGRTALMTAVAERRPEVVSLLLSRGADLKNVLAPHPSIFINSRTASPLDCYRGGSPNWNGAVVRSLIEHGLAVDTLLEPREPLIIMATLAGDVETVEFLVAKGAAVDAKDNQGWTALYYAEIQSSRKIASVLIRAGGKKYW